MIPRKQRDHDRHASLIHRESLGITRAPKRTDSGGNDRPVPGLPGPVAYKRMASLMERGIEDIDDVFLIGGKT